MWDVADPVMGLPEFSPLAPGRRSQRFTDSLVPIPSSWVRHPAYWAAHITRKETPETDSASQMTPRHIQHIRRPVSRNIGWIEEMVYSLDHQIPTSLTPDFEEPLAAACSRWEGVLSISGSHTIAAEHMGS